MRRGKRLGLVALGVLGAALAAGLGALGVIPHVKGRYDNSDPALAVAYRAKETCSCLFVLGRDEAYCRAWTEARPDVARLTIDPARRVVEARALGLWSARARVVDARTGCVLE